MSLLRMPVFKGATRPACVWGIPIKPFTAAAGSFFILGTWVWTPLVLGIVPALALMHAVTDRDDQAFRQLWLRLRVTAAGRRRPRLA